MFLMLSPPRLTNSAAEERPPEDKPKGGSWIDSVTFARVEVRSRTGVTILA